jgi:hypothetical protein
LVALLVAYQAQVESSNDAVDVANQAADRYNSGQASIVEVFRADVQTAIADLEPKTAAVHAALETVERAITDLERGPDG